MKENIFKVKDKDGISVILRKIVWEDKILSPSPKGHPEVKPYLNEIKKTIMNPELIFRSHQKENIKLFYRLEVGKGEYTKCHILVVVKYVIEEKNQIIGYVLTSYLTRKIYSKGELLWKKRKIISQ